MTSTMTIESGHKVWRNKQGQLHRLDGPAIESADGTKEWYQKGQRHRLDGPAIEYADGTKEWWIEGKRCCAAVCFREGQTTRKQYVETYAQAYEMMCENLRNEICSWAEELK